MEDVLAINFRKARDSVNFRIARILEAENGGLFSLEQLKEDVLGHLPRIPQVAGTGVPR